MKKSEFVTMLHAAVCTYDEHLRNSDKKTIITHFEASKFAVEHEIRHPESITPAEEDVVVLAIISITKLLAHLNLKPLNILEVTEAVDKAFEYYCRTYPQMAKQC